MSRAYALAYPRCGLRARQSAGIVISKLPIDSAGSLRDVNERDAGIGPAMPVWKTDVIPFN